ncbi:molecular chaperone TorD family protein [Desulfosudis oleivorans]|uniref:Delta-subunit of ethylbenzene dehydrogenase n=1 Tax=Desulfosudis oleivorans (strain DSM 6200 / JCM 39069 / Hxd3) TaxID=96561 RepID=A8ZSU4_DESOH|nr:molecular chaperone TorD family protein [Desulfosudis oleivorans]ABW66007.1 delta-subunit of ethylbenzene dehydrogenase [Desulfosudis oleivorans Hxd3]
MNQAAVDMANGYDDAQMAAFRSAELTSDADKQAAARSDMYALMADLFRYPDKEFQAFVRNGELRDALVGITENLPFACALSDGETEKLQFSPLLDEDGVEAGFIRLFEAGPGDPPCPLIEGKYVKDSNRRAIFEDLIRFYNHFGLSYAEGAHEDRPDHVIYEMEFMHYICFLTLRAGQQEKSIEDLLLAQRDFLKHHLLKWAGKLAERVAEVVNDIPEDYAGTFYTNVARLLARFIEADYAYLNEAQTR